MFSREELVEMGFAYVGKDVKVFKNSVFANCSNIYLGDGCQIDDFVHIIASKPVKIGKRVHVACFTSISGGGEVTVGDYCGISAGCRLISGTDDFLGGGLVGPTMPLEYRNVDRSFIVMEKFSLLGTNTIVLPGVTLFEGAATGTGTHVSKDLAPWGIYLGPNAKRIKGRPSEEMYRLAKEMTEKYSF